MAKNTDIKLRNQIVYQVFVRQHSKTGNFQGLIDDLDRIKSLGVDIVYLLPFHKIGQKDRKGSKGSPYSIYDYYSIDPDYGTLDDFIKLKEEIHKRDMKLMIDIVFNHTSRDSILTQTHPEWFYRNPDGTFKNRVGDWSDITDLDFNNRDVWEYLITVLKYWAQYVDGFRCDVAPLLPIDFWIEAREKVSIINPNLIWLTESVELGFIKYLRDIGFDAYTDSQMYEAFDVCYDYDIYSFMNGYLNHSNSLERYLYEIWRQEAVYPKNYVKLRSFENHDQERLASKTKDENQLIHMTALQFFLRGMPMIYAGQEHKISKRPDLFEIDPIQWNKENSIEPLIQKLAQIKKDPLFINGIFEVVKSKDIAVLSYKNDKETMYGIFNLEDINEIDLNIKDGLYLNLINDENIEVRNQKIKLNQNPIIFKVK